MSGPKRADQLLEEALNTFKERRKVYGTSYLKHAEVMKVLFPDGIALNTEVDFARFSILNMLAVKLVRYCNDFYNPHQDSIHDNGVYSFVQEELDQFANDEAAWEAWKQKETAKDQTYPSNVRDWIKDAIEATGGFSPDRTDAPDL